MFFWPKLLPEMQKVIIQACAVVSAAILLFIAIGYETWAAMTIWGMFAPPLPFNLVTGMGLSIAVSLIFRQMPRCEDTYDTWEMGKKWAQFYLLSPTIALLAAWALAHLK